MLKKERKKERLFMFLTQHIFNIQLKFWYSVDWYDKEVYKLGSGNMNATERINLNTWEERRDSGRGET
jgi:hypothetical protein